MKMIASLGIIPLHFESEGVYNKFYRKAKGSFDRESIGFDTLDNAKFKMQKSKLQRKAKSELSFEF